MCSNGSLNKSWRLILFWSLVLKILISGLNISYMLGSCDWGYITVLKLKKKIWLAFYKNKGHCQPNLSLSTSHTLKCTLIFIAHLDNVHSPRLHVLTRGCPGCIIFTPLPSSTSTENNISSGGIIVSGDNWRSVGLKSSRSTRLCCCVTAATGRATGIRHSFPPWARALARSTRVLRHRQHPRPALSRNVSPSDHHVPGTA